VLDLVEEIDPKKKVRTVVEEKQLLELLSFEPNGLTESGLYGMCKATGIYKRKANFSKAVRRLIAGGEVAVIGETLFFNAER